MSTIEAGGDRQALLEQLSHLAEEIEAFASQLEAIPPDVLEIRPVEAELSLKEIYALIAAYDRRIYLPIVERLEQGEAADLDHGNITAEGSLEMEELLRTAASGRRELVAHLEAVRDWGLGVRIDGTPGNVLDFAYAIIRHDTELLRTAARRLHELGRLG